MIFDRSADDMDSWRNQMKNYQKSKRTKKPFGKSMPHVDRVTYSEVKLKQTQFNPLLQSYKHVEDEKKAQTVQQFNRVKSLMNHIKNVKKYQRNFDIVNLHAYSGNQDVNKPLNKKLGPIRNAYNVINNQKLPDFYFKGRDIVIPQDRQKNLIDYHKKEFDIITGMYKQNNEEKYQRQRIEENLHSVNKYWKTHNYDPVYGKFYDVKKQEEYQKHREQMEKIHGKDYEKKLPPSYVNRESLILDFEKPLPESLMTLDQVQHNRQKKFQLKYIIQDEYQDRNQEEDYKYERVIKNRIHDGRLLDEKSKQFNIITNNNYSAKRVQTLYGKKPKLNSWDQFIKPTDNVPKFIKTSGFK